MIAFTLSLPVVRSITTMPQLVKRGPSSLRITLSAILLFTCASIFITQAQAQPSKQQQLSEAQKKLNETKARLAEVDARLKELFTLLEEQDALTKQIKEQERLIGGLTQEAQSEAEEEAAFQESKPQKILDVSGLDTFLIDFNGTSRWVRLHGVRVNSFAVSLTVFKEYRKRLVKKKLFVRCASPDCGRVYLYELKTSPSLNSLLVAKNDATATDDALFDVAKYLPQPASTDSNVRADDVTKRAAEINSRTAGTEVQVKGYYRKDGTYVRPHTRSRPRR